MTQNLYRRQAIEHSTRRINGEVIIITPLSNVLIGGILIVILIIGLTFVSLADYTRKETVSGWLVPDSGVVRIKAIRDGVVSKLPADAGDFVTTRDRIVEINSEIGTNLSTSREHLIESFEKRINAANDSLLATESRLNAQTVSLQEELKNAKQEKLALEQQLVFLAERIQRANENQNWARENFALGITTRVDVESWTAAAQELEQDRLEIQQSHARLTTKISGIESKITIVSPLRRAARAELIALEAELSEQIIRTSSQFIHFIAPPISGHIETVQVELGQSVRAGDTIAVLRPLNSKLIAELYVPSRAAGFLREGQIVNVKYEAFPYQRFGTSEAEIVDVSRSILTSTEVEMPDHDFEEPVFRVRAKLNSDKFYAYGEFFDLRSGAQLKADIIIEKNRLHQWLFSPLYATRRGQIQN